MAQFNPFTDRLSRDIRNTLSHTISEVLASGSLAAAEQAASPFIHGDLAPHYRRYIQHRLKCYRQATDSLAGSQASVVRQAVVLWDLGCYFEVHEVLEPAWMTATGDEKRLLQALIRAAGVYINLELGYRQRAAKIGAKAIPVLIASRTHLAALMNIDELIGALESLSEQPPRLGLSEPGETGAPQR
jgi:hypothetical protein